MNDRREIYILIITLVSIVAMVMMAMSAEGQEVEVDGDVITIDLGPLLDELRQEMDNLQDNQGDLLTRIEELEGERSSLELSVDPELPRELPAAEVAHGQEVVVDSNQLFAVTVYSNLTDEDREVHSGAGPAVFQLPELGVHTIIVTPAVGEKVRFFVDHQPPRSGDLRVEEVRGASNGFEMQSDHPEDLVVEGVRYQGVDSHGPEREEGVGVFIRNKSGGTVTVRDVEAFDLSAGIVVQGRSRDEPIKLAVFRDVRIRDTWKDYLDSSNFWTDRPQGLFTANIERIEAEGLEIFQSYRPGLSPLFDRWHNWYASGSDKQLLQFETHIRNSVFIAGSFSGLNISQLSSADRVYIIGSPVNWNVDGRIDTGWVPPITGKVTRSYSINPSRTPVFNRSPEGEDLTKPWGQHFIYEESPIPGVTVIDDFDLDLDAIIASPRGRAYLEVEKQLGIVFED